MTDTVLTPELWDRIRTNEQLLSQAPEWVQVVLCLSFDDISQLPENIRNEPLTRPFANRWPLDESYLNFLREQIDLNAQGKEWSALLEKRLNARKNYVGYEMLYFDIYQIGKHFSLTMLYPSLDIVDWEISYPIWE